MSGIPPDFREFLIEMRPQLAAEDLVDQHKLAAFAWHCVGGHREHLSYEGYQAHSHEYLDKLFGRARLLHLNRRTQVFMVLPGDRFNGLSQGFAVMPDIEQKLHYRYSSIPGTPTAIVNDTGRRVVARPPVLRSRNANGNNAHVWKGTRILNVVPVDCDAMEHLANSMRPGAMPIAEYFHGWRPTRHAPLNYLTRLMQLAHTTLAGRGAILHEYQEAGTGRLNALGVSLQTAPRPVRAAALNGTWDYDFANCHYCVLEQLAGRLGIRCPNVEYYLANKRQVRAHVADVGGITTEDDAKDTMISLIYGASASGAPGTRLLELVGHEGLQALRRDPVFAGIAREICTAGEAVIAKWPRSRGGLLLNDVGKGIDPRKGWLGEHLAHLLQGAEAGMLKACIKAHEDDVLLPFHDGFVSGRRLDCASLEGLVLRETGYRMVVEEKPIRYGWGDGMQRV